MKERKKKGKEEKENEGEGIEITRGKNWKGGNK